MSRAALLALAPLTGAALLLAWPWIAVVGSIVLLLRLVAEVFA